MRSPRLFIAMLTALVPAACLIGIPASAEDVPVPPPAEDAAATRAPDERMAWWREARFGLFIHWGLYAVPAGEWKGTTDHGEWIMNSAQIPVEAYETFVPQFNPVQFDADHWVRMAKDAGMKYIVITTKHHDGFCLFDSNYTDYDIMSTPFQRDIMKELSDACRREGIRICWYHSIMDWHHPDYLPRRPWESRTELGADFDRYVTYLKSQVSELLTRYGDIGVMWFDGEWERTWNHAYGADLYQHVRTLQPKTIVNNRVDVGRGGMEGMSESNKYKGDFGTPEQQIPSTGIPGVDWETCMTMNRHWGYNRHDTGWKSTEELVRTLVDISSKGGNYLLNVGPTADGLFPGPSVSRLAEIGRWMKVNAESIHGTRASPFASLAYGRCTMKQGAGGIWRVYLHVFDWPADGELPVPAMDNAVRSARLLATGETLPLASRDGKLMVRLPASAPDPTVSVLVLEVAGKPVVIGAPSIVAASSLFIDRTEVVLETDVREATIRYTLDGSAPTASSPDYFGPIVLTDSATVRAQLFRAGKPLSEDDQARFERVSPRPADTPAGLAPGLAYACYEGSWERLPSFDSLVPTATGTSPIVDLGLRTREEHFGLRFTGYVRVPSDAVYTFYSDSDDGSRLFIGDRLVVDNDGLHSPTEVSGQIALAAGLHPVSILFFESTGGQELNIGISAPGLAYRELPGDWLFHP